MAQKFLILRCTDSEHAGYLADATKHGETLSSWARRCLRLGRVHLLLADERPETHQEQTPVKRPAKRQAKRPAKR